jgi:hypothetical protein
MMQEEEKKGSSNSSTSQTGAAEEDEETDRHPLTGMNPQDTIGSLTTAMSSLGISSRRKLENPTRRFSDYNILKIIGTGTFGKVYLATL